MANRKNTKQYYKCKKGKKATKSFLLAYKYNICERIVEEKVVKEKYK